MAGRKQHHIPRFLQRGFAITGSDEHKIWRFDRERLPTKSSSIRSTAYEEDFYSEPSPDGSRTLDDEITDQESQIAEVLSELRLANVGTIVAPDVAAKLVNHLAPRSAHLRQTFTHGMRQVLAGLAELFSDSDWVQAKIGIDQPKPNEVFRTSLGNELRDDKTIIPLALPGHVIERIIFYLVKEHFEGLSKEAIPAIRNTFDKLKEKSGDIARSGHNKVLGDFLEPNARFDFLRTLSWRTIPSPPEGAILPDCVAVALRKSGTAAPFVLTGFDETAAVVIPLSAQALLIGVTDNTTLSSNFIYNQEAARSSHCFFLAATNNVAMAALQPLIGEFSSNFVDNAIAEALNKYKKTPQTADKNRTDEHPPSVATKQTNEIETSWSYQVSFLDCADEVTAKSIADAIKQIVNIFDQSLPLRRLEGITFAYDYAAAITKVDRGRPDLTPPSTINQSIGVWIAQTITVIRDEVIMYHIVMNGTIAHALISESEQQINWAVSITTWQLAIVALNNIIDERLPGVLLQPIPDPLQSWLYSLVDLGTKGYIASYICPGLGDPDEIVEESRQRLAEALDRMQAMILPARLDYRYHGDLDALLAVTSPLIQNVLSFSGDLLGQCTALEVEPAPPDSALAVALDRAGLRLWLPRYQADLEALRLRLGRWESFDEFLALNVHVERLLWQHGMIPWSSDEGIRVEIPIGSDAQALMAGLKAAALKSD